MSDETGLRISRSFVTTVPMSCYGAGGGEHDVPAGARLMVLRDEWNEELRECVAHAEELGVDVNEGSAA